MAQIPWATAQADRSREELRRIYLDENGQETRPIPTSKEEELLASLLGANQELLEAFRIYDDLERLGVAEQEEREVEERSRKETKLDRTVRTPFAVTFFNLSDGSRYGWIANPIHRCGWVIPDGRHR
jgi:hypothetical protein